ncbi:MAG: hypothetical protein R8K47_01640 [Mariprofundaceae bacterium]
MQVNKGREPHAASIARAPLICTLASALRLFAAMIAETHEALLSRKYLDMDEFYEWLETRRHSRAGVVAMK